MKQAGIIILALGIIIIIFTGFKFVSKEKASDIGGLEITHKQKHDIVWSPEVGVALMVVGSAVLFVRARSSKSSKTL